MSEASPHRDAVTRILGEINAGDPHAIDRLMPLVYDELRAIAHNKLSSERSDHTLKTTDLVHEAYLRLVEQDRVEWTGRHHFYAVAAQAMRRILVNYAKARSAQKRGEGRPALRITAQLAESLPLSTAPENVLALHEALNRMEKFNERGCRVVEYRFFAGLSQEEIAELLGLSKMTVRRDWMAARSWLQKELANPASHV